jgi:hypothetical protein
MGTPRNGEGLSRGVGLIQALARAALPPTRYLLPFSDLFTGE